MILKVTQLEYDAHKSTMLQLSLNRKLQWPGHPVIRNYGDYLVALLLPLNSLPGAMPENRFPSLIVMLVLCLDKASLELLDYHGVPFSCLLALIYSSTELLDYHGVLRTVGLSWCSLFLPTYIDIFFDRTVRLSWRP
jgi:hypothetical protein